MTDTIYDKFVAVDEILRGALQEYQDNEIDEIRPRVRTFYKQLVEVMPEIMKSLQQEIRHQLWSKNAAFQ